ncbi:cysteine-rich CWC family protein [Photobacterium sanguinicancri]|uniref:cysteine-rich CWC family protein n=1 Tax=Photobacterium sanguinicancri TaxID=875932 RepID=UPI0026E36D5F|nr:cysteine-rich CWC family protein [Photobacterium sanguinicancri]MDO6500630.1 cysteine-rich CWC family protein [Photobacterium sanguinicancri]
MKTPCIGICKNKGGVCTGCHRTMSEIQQWRYLTDEQRNTKMEQIHKVVSTHTCQQCGQPAFCEISAGESHCWCFEITKRDTTSIKGAHCLCRSCLSKLPIKVG